jgi:hypothetical protein
MRERQSRGYFPAGVAALLVFASIARADFLLVSQSLTVDQPYDAAIFQLTFNQAPDFYTLNSQGQPADAFQINFAGIYPAPGVAFPRNLTAVVRGSEIHEQGTIRIRSATGNGGPEAGGWGPVVDSVPFSLLGDTVDFSIPERDLGWNGHSTAQYRVFSLQYGQQTASETVTLVPTPTALESGLVGLLIVAAVTAYMQHHHHRGPRERYR